MKLPTKSATRPQARGRKPRDVLLLPRDVADAYPEQYGHYRAGQPFCVYAAAPGTGSWVYRITRLDAAGIWGVLVCDSVRILTPGEVR